MSKRNIFCLILTLCIFFAGMQVAAQSFSGTVFSGDQGDESTPISGVTVSLYGSNNSGQKGSYITSTTTDGSGGYSLAAEAGWEFYTIEETDPSGYYSVGASSAGGSVQDANSIQYSTASAPLSNQTLTGNKFWDKPQSTTYTWTGKVFEGNVGDETTPLSGCYLTLEAGGTQITSHTTGSNGSYYLPTAEAHQYYDIVLKSYPSGYTPVGATSMGGTVSSNQQINFSSPLSGQNLTGNKFWLTKQTANNPPIAEANGTYNGTVGTAIELDATGSYDPDAGDSITKYEWDFESDGTYDATTMSVKYTWNHNRLAGYTGTVTLRVTDSHGATGTDQARVQITDSGLNEGTLIIEKQTIPDGATDMFSITGDITYHLKDNDKVTINNLMTGTYTLTETALTGWALTNISVNDANSTVNIGTRTAVVQLDAGETVHVIFTNTKAEAKDYDFGDVPVGYDQSAHTTLHSTFFLGSSVDNESAAQPNITATGDDSDGNDDEDGVTFTTALIPMQTASVDVTIVSANILEPWLTIWIDYNQNQIWDDAEKVVDVKATAGTHTFTFTVPGSVKMGDTYAHALLSDIGPVPTWGVRYGEIEDYQVTIREGGTPEYDFGDLPDPIYLTLNANGGPYHPIVPNVFLGSSVDGEADGQPTADATGDDLVDGNDDDDGVTFLDPIIGGQSLRIQVVASVAGYLNAWIDYNVDGDFDDMGERICTDEVLVAGTNLLTKTVYGGAMPGQTFSRFRFSTVGGCCWAGPADDGEVEDYAITVLEPNGQAMDYGDAPDVPYPTLAASFGASHVIVPTVYLGQSVDPELDGQPSADAAGDDLDGNDDDDGVTLNSPLLVGQAFHLTVTASVNGFLNAWIDFDGDGLLNNLTAERIFTDQQLTAGANALTVNIPATAQLGETFARFRFTTQSGCCYSGSAPDGEVEDYKFFLETGGGFSGALKWSQPPLLQEFIELDTVCFLGWRELSWNLMPVAADDWFCYDDRPVTSIRWWGGYADWDTTFAPPNAPAHFHIGVWTDIPKYVDRDFSHPERLIHEWMVEREAVENVDRCMFFPERMEKPITGFEYFFAIPPNEWFYQEEDSTVYWLSITAIYEENPDSLHWGWLTREHYFHDDALLMFLPETPHMDSWFEDGEVFDHRWDLAFELGTDVYERSFDFGDAPEEAFATVLERNGAHHRIVPEVRLGELVDEEIDGQFHVTAQGDDFYNEDDEDGVEFITPLVRGHGAEIVVRTSTRGFLNGWLDQDGDGNWHEPHDHVLYNIELPPGEFVLGFHVEEFAAVGLAVARFRFSRESEVWFNGFAMDGEVEDYVVTIDQNMAVDDKPASLPTTYKMFANYPNPFNPSTAIIYELPQKANVVMEIYNIRGAKVKTLVDGNMNAGRHTVEWDGTDSNGVGVTSGLYICFMRAPGYTKTIRMLYLK